MLNKKNILVAFILFLVCFLVYANNIHNDFMMDDLGSFLEFEKVQSFRYLPEVFSPSFVESGLHYRPFYQITNTILYHFFDARPQGYRIVCIILFFTYSFLLFLFMKRISKNSTVALLASILFVTHPIHGMVVNYIASYVIPLAGVFWLGSLICWCLYLEKRNLRFYYTSLISFIVALFIYEQSVLLPLYLLCVTFIIYKINLKRSSGMLWPFFVLALGFTMFLITRSHAFGHWSEAGLPVGSVLASVANLIFWYLTKLLTLQGVVLIWSMDPVREGWWIQSLLFAGVVSVVLFLMWRFRRENLLTFSLVWFFVGFLPLGITMFIRPNLGLVVEPHWFFLSSAGYFLFLALILTRLKERLNKKVSWAFLASLILFYSLTSHRYNTLWKDVEAYSTYWLKENLHNDLARYNLIRPAIEKGEFEKAFHHSNLLLKNRYFQSSIYHLLGLMKGFQGDHSLASEYFQKAVETGIYPFEVIDAYHNLGVSFIFQSKIKKAEEIFKEANNRYPQSTKIAANLVRLYLMEKRISEAIILLEGYLGKYPHDKALLELADEVLSRKDLYPQGLE